MKKLIVFAILMSSVFFQHTTYAQSMRYDTIYFEQNLYELDKVAFEKIDLLIFSLSEVTNYKIKLYGNTDNKGTSAYNDKLSADRVNVVLNYLIDKGINKENVELAYYGEAKPIKNNVTTEGRAKNRRVEIQTSFKLGSIDDIKKSFQVYNIDPQKDNTIKAKEGTVLYIKANTLVDSLQNTAKGEVKILIREFYSIGDMIIENISTNMNGDILETGGMIQVVAVATNGKKLQIKQENFMGVVFSSNYTNGEMNIFYGNRGGDNIVDWHEREESGFRWSGGIRDDLDCYQGNESICPPTGEIPANYTLWERFLRFFNLYDYAESEYQYITRIKKEEECRRFNIIADSIMALDIEARLQAIPNVKYEHLRNYLSQQHKQEYEKVLSEKMKSANNENINLPYDIVQSKMFSSAKLGWINCDRFANSKEEKIEFTVNDKKADEVVVNMVFKDMKSLLRSVYDNGGKKHIFKNIPTNNEVIIIAYKIIDNIPYLASKTINTKEKSTGELEYKILTYKKLKEEIDYLSS